VGDGLTLDTAAINRQKRHAVHLEWGLYISMLVYIYQGDLCKTPPFAQSQRQGGLEP